MLGKDLNLTVHSDPNQPKPELLPDTVLSDSPSDFPANTPSISTQSIMINVEAEQKQDVLTPKDIELLAQTNPDLANRFMTVYEQDHRADNNIKSAQAIVLTDIPKRQRRGQWMVFSLAVLVILVGGFLAYIGHPGFGLGETFGGLGCLKFLIWDPFAKREGQDK